MNKLIYAALISLFLSLAVTAYSNEIQEDLQSNLVRLHILANSDSECDQAVKLKVRDALLGEMNEKMQTETKDGIVGNLTEIEQIANEVLAQNGCAYTAHAVYGKFDFPKKEYKNMTLPAGEYYGVRVILGDGAGHNWWCVMYPPLCVADDGSPAMDGKSEEILKSSLKSETYDIITGADADVTIKFKAVEFVQEIRQKMKKK